MSDGRSCPFMFDTDRTECDRVLQPLPPFHYAYTYKSSTVGCEEDLAGLVSNKKAICGCLPAHVGGYQKRIIPPEGPDRDDANI